MTVHEIVVAQLRAMGADGLYQSPEPTDDGEPCGCILGDLATCGVLPRSCVAARNGGDSEGNMRNWVMIPLRTEVQR